MNDIGKGTASTFCLLCGQNFRLPKWRVYSASVNLYTAHLIPITRRNMDIYPTLLGQYRILRHDV